jgi:hypothetical protein
MNEEESHGLERATELIRTAETILIAYSDLVMPQQSSFLIAQCVGFRPNRLFGIRRNVEFTWELHALYWSLLYNWLCQKSGKPTYWVTFTPREIMRTIYEAVWRRFGEQLNPHWSRTNQEVMAEWIAHIEQHYPDYVPPEYPRPPTLSLAEADAEWAALAHRFTIDIRISNAIYWRHPERGCLDETAWFPASAGATTAERDGLAEAEVVAA